MNSDRAVLTSLECPGYALLSTVGMYFLFERTRIGAPQIDRGDVKCAHSVCHLVINFCPVLQLVQ